MGLFSRKKEAEESQNRGYFEYTSGGTDPYLFDNILYIIQEMKNNHKELIDRIDTLLAENKKLNERCEILENRVGMKKR